MKRHHLIGLLLAPCAWPAANASADMITYTVDPTQSSLTISGTYAGYPLQAQDGVPDSLTTLYSGTITAERDVTADTLQITSGTVAAQTTGAATPSTSTPADYGFVTLLPDVNGHFQPSFFGGIVGFSFSTSGPAIAVPATFDMTQLVASIISGEIEWTYHPPGRAGGSGGTIVMAGASALISASGSLIGTASLETLTLPIETDFTCIPFGTTESLDIHFSGTIVATATVPEPTGLLLLGIPAFFLLRRRCGKRHRE